MSWGSQLRCPPTSWTGECRGAWGHAVCLGTVPAGHRVMGISVPSRSGLLPVTHSCSQAWLRLPVPQQQSRESPREAAFSQKTSQGRETEPDAHGVPGCVVSPGPVVSRPHRTLQSLASRSICSQSRGRSSRPGSACGVAWGSFLIPCPARWHAARCLCSPRNITAVTLRVLCAACSVSSVPSWGLGHAARVLPRPRCAGLLFKSAGTSVHTSPRLSLTVGSVGPEKGVGAHDVLGGSWPVVSVSPERRLCFMVPSA